MSSKLDIKIDQELVSNAVQKAILDQIGDNARDQMIAAALTYLLDPKNTRYGSSGLAPIQEAFNDAVGVAASKIVHELVASDPEIKKRILQYVGEALLKVDEKEFSNHVGNALASALRNNYDH